MKKKKLNNQILTGIVFHRWVVFMLVLVLVSSIFTVSEKVHANPYGGGDGNCTYTAWRLAYENTGIQLPGWGNACTWYDSARNAGYTVSTVPREKSIAVWSGGPKGLGHVAYVSQVSGNQIYIHEGGYDGGYHEGWENAYGKTKYYNLNYLTMIGYIYLYNNPDGYVDIAEGISGGIKIAGWALDKDNSAVNLDIHVYIGGEAGSSTGECHPIKANKHRPDVGFGDYHGFEDTILTNKHGQQRVYVYALNIEGGDNVCLGSYTVNIKKPDSESPVLVGYDITNLNEKGYTITCTWKDNVGVTKVEFPTWDSETQSGADATWYQGISSEVGKTESTWKFTFSKAESGRKYFTHIYASDAAGNRTCFPLTRTAPVASPIEVKNDTTAPVFEKVALTQEEEGTVVLSVQLSDDTGLGKLSRPGGRFLWYSTDKNSSCLLADYSTGIKSNINCWNNQGGSVPIVEKNYTVEETTSVQCDSIVGYGIMAQDLSGNYAVGNQLFNNEYISYQIRSGNIKGQKNKSIEISLNRGEEITLSEIRKQLSPLNSLNGSDVYFDAKNERILKKSNHPDSNMISDREEEKKVVLTANESGTEYVYFVNLLTGGVCSCKIQVKNENVGDVYQDGVIDGKDVSLLLQYRLKKRELTEEQIAAGDVYADGKIDGKDVSRLLQYRLGKISSLE